MRNAGGTSGEKKGSVGEKVSGASDRAALRTPAGPRPRKQKKRAERAERAEKGRKGPKRAENGYYPVVLLKGPKRPL
eukprot:7996624-Pyramimonas_sp.AAC.1